MHWMTLNKHINVELNVYKQCNHYRRGVEMQQDMTSMQCITLSPSSVAPHEAISSIFWGSLKARGLRLVARSAGGLTFWQHHPPHYDHNHEPHIHDGHQCDHKHHLNMSTNTIANTHPNMDANPNVTMNWTRTPVWTQIPPPSPWSEPRHMC